MDGLKRIVIGLSTLFFLVGCSTWNSRNNGVNLHGGSVNPVQLPDYGQAPELQNQTWLNVENPLRIADLSGKVILLEMWTFG
jgi:hypothetical protein